MRRRVLAFVAVVLGACDSTSGAGDHPAAAGGDSPQSDPCLGIVCDTPPAPACDSAGALEIYDTLGSCAEGVCSYAMQVIACSCERGACASDPCVGVTCDSPPAASCKDQDTLTSYAQTGTCNETGSCSYAPKDALCEFGCNLGECNPDPCASVTCDELPAATCKDASTKTTYSATCSGGHCNYAPTDTACGANQQCGGAGVCSVCKTDATCGADCGACSGGTPKCKDLGTTSTCVACVSNADCSDATPVCNTTTNVCQRPASCDGLAATCGPGGNADCCASNLVTGGTFNRLATTSYPATVADFRLDNYEITVGRFRKFVVAFSQTMTASGAGKNPNNASDTGWDTAWNTSLDADATALITELSLNCGGTWTDSAGTAEAESLPITCIDWFEAEAFCIWDGGRLPTAAEWNYAAEGGTAYRHYPWGSADADCSYANFYAPIDPAYQYNLDYCVSPRSAGGDGAVNRVGSESPKGDGLYGQSDLAGNVWEWVQDWYADYPPNPCDNCADLTASTTARMVWGGGFEWYDMASSSYRNNYPPNHLSTTGARCAR